MIKKFILLCGVFLFAVTIEAAVAYDSSNKGTQTGGTSITDFDVTVVGTTNVACVIGLQFDTTTVSAIAITVDGISASAIANTTATYTTGIRTIMYSVALGASISAGPKTVHITWTTTSGASAGVICATGVDQTTPANNGANHADASASTPYSLAITSQANDMTVDIISDVSGNAVSAPTQTSRLTINNSQDCIGAATCIALSTAAGSASNTHSWTITATDAVAQSGANFLQASAGGATCKSRFLLLGAGGC